MTNIYESGTSLDRAALQEKVAARKRELAQLTAETGPGLMANLHRSTTAMAEARLRQREII
jgi:hypothetical protein